MTGLRQALAAAPSSEQVMEVGVKPATRNEIVALVEVVVAGGAWLTTIDGAAVAGATATASTDTATTAIPRALHTIRWIGPSPDGVSENPRPGYPERGGPARVGNGALARRPSVRYS